MSMHKHDHPELGWLGLAVYVAVTDMTGTRTMSEVFKAASRHRVFGPALLCGWCYLSAHLFGLIDPRWDLFHRIGCHKKCVHGQG